MPVATLGTYAIGTEALAGEGLHGQPTVVIDAPAQDALVSGALTVSWTYTPNPITLLAQGWYRVRLYSSDRSLTHYDTGWFAGATGTATIPVTSFSDTLTYQVGVMARPIAPGDSGLDDSTEQFVTVSTDLDDLDSYPDLSSVGTIYEVGINGVGYMLADMTETDRRYNRKSVALDSQRFATSNTPFSEGVDRYVFRTFSDFSGGAGQRYLDHEDSSPTAFWGSENVNPFVPGKLTMNASIRASAASIDLGTPTGTTRAVQGAVFNQALYLAPFGDNNTVYTTTDLESFDDDFAIAATVEIYDITSSGEHWYMAGGATGIFRNTSAADPGAAWSAVPARWVEWVGDRIAAAYPTSGTTPNVFTTLNDAGVEEVGGGRLVLPDGWEIVGITSNGGKVWFTANSVSADRGNVYVWTLGSADPPTIALEFPGGHRPRAILAYQGNVFLRVGEWTEMSATAKAHIYRCVPAADGTLTPTLVTTLGDATSTIDQAKGSFTARGTRVYFTWLNMTDLGLKHGVGAIDLIGGGWCKWTYLSDTGISATLGNIGQLINYGEALVWPVGDDADEFFVMHSVGATNNGIEADGWLETAFIDGNSNLLKVYDSTTTVASLETDDQSITVAYSIDGVTNTAIPEATLTGPNAAIDAPWAKRARQVSFTLGLNGFDSKTTMFLSSFSVKFHQLGLADQIIVLPVLCDDNLASLHGARLGLDSGPGKGSLRARTLEALAQTRVKLQDKDWAFTRTSLTCEVINVDVAEWSVRAAKTGLIQESLVATLTLRRALR